MTPMARNTVVRVKGRQDQLRFETLVADLSSGFINLVPGEVDHAIMDALRRICEDLDIDLAAVWQWTHAPAGALAMTHLYHSRKGPQSAAAFRKEDFPWMVAQLGAGRTVVLESLEDLPAKAAHDRRVARRAGIKSNVTIPLAVGGGATIGVLGLNTIRMKRAWPKRLVNRLRLMAQIFANALARKFADQALRESEERFRQLTGNIHEVFYLERLGAAEVLYVSPAYEKIWGRPCGELRTNPGAWVTAVHPDDRERLLDMLRSRRPREGHDIEYRIIRPDGGFRWIRDRSFPVLDEAGKVYRLAGICEDITERKRLQRELLDISEHEQQRIGHDLHDGLGQKLAGISFLAGSLCETLKATSPSNASEAGRICTLLGDAIQDMRSLAKGLLPVRPEPVALMSSLVEMVGSVQRLRGGRCGLKCPHPVLLHDQHVATNLYRIAQEALNNALRHGKPARIWISLIRRKRGALVLEIRDDGVGLKKRAPSHRGMGLEIMKYRAADIGASLSVAPGPRCGTVVRCVWQDGALP